MKQYKVKLALCVMFCSALFLFQPNKCNADVLPKQTTTVQETTTTTQAPTTSKKVEKDAPKIKKIKLVKPKIKISKHYENHVTLQWTKVKNAQKYYVYRATAKSKFKKIAITKKKQYIDKKAKKRITYSYKVVAVAKKSGKTFESKASNKQTTYVKPKTPKVVVAGECFVEGMVLYAKGYLPSNFRIVHKIGLSTYGLINVNYFSYGGQKVTGLEKIALYKPDQVFILIGMNEATNNNTSNTINNYKNIVSKLRKVNPNVEVILLALPPVGRSKPSTCPNNSQVNNYNNAYKAFADKTKNVYYYSGHRALLKDSTGYLKSSANGGDGCHWSSSVTIDVVKNIIKESKALTKR